MENLEIGKLHTFEQHRDAVHMAIIPVTSNETLLGGQHVGLYPDGTVGTLAMDTVGIVDPFLTTNTRVGKKFWLFLYPGSITSLRHEWTHPAFQDNPVAEPEFTQSHKDTAERVAKRLQGITPSEEWMKEYAERLGQPYDELMERTKSHVESGAYWSKPEFEGESIPNGFWDHFEEIIGKKVEPENRDDFFTCSC